jgi:hypothetical protein
MKTNLNHLLKIVGFLGIFSILALESTVAKPQNACVNAYIPYPMTIRIRLYCQENMCFDFIQDEASDVVEYMSTDYHSCDIVGFYPPEEGNCTVLQNCP